MTESGIMKPFSAGPSDSGSMLFDTVYKLLVVFILNMILLVFTEPWQLNYG